MYIKLNLDFRSDSARNLALCVGIMYGFQPWLTVLQYVEFHRWQGMQKFFFFYSNMHQSIREIFDFYEKLFPGLIVPIYWMPSHYTCGPDYRYLFHLNLTKLMLELEKFYWCLNIHPRSVFLEFFFEKIFRQFRTNFEKFAFCGVKQLRIKIKFCWQFFPSVKKRFTKTNFQGVKSCAIIFVPIR